MNTPSATVDWVEWIWKLKKEDKIVHLWKRTETETLLKTWQDLVSAKKKKKKSLNFTICLLWKECSLLSSEVKVKISNKWEFKFPNNQSDLHVYIPDQHQLLNDNNLFFIYIHYFKMSYTEIAWLLLSRKRSIPNFRYQSMQLYSMR